MKIVSIGESTIDHYPDLNRSFVGGISLNFAVHARRCGADAVSLVSRVGRDEAGRCVYEKLEQERVDSSYVAMLAGETATCDIRVVDHGERVFPPGGYHRNVLADFRLTPEELRFIRQQDVLAVMYDGGQEGGFFHQVMAELDFDGKRVADFGDWAGYGDDHDALIASLTLTDLAFVSGPEAAIDTLRPISTRHDGLIVVTRGAEGSAALVEGVPIFQPARTVPTPVDSTGCGDAFQAAFTTVYFRTGSIEQALREGSDRAAEVLQHYGAMG